ncbi:hypothetical protein Trydic_g3532 [Trypoxylus dichotomus]
MNKVLILPFLYTNQRGPSSGSRGRSLGIKKGENINHLSIRTGGGTKGEAGEGYGEARAKRKGTGEEDDLSAEAARWD